METATPKTQNELINKVNFIEKTAYRSLSSAQATTLLNYGLYNNEKVNNNEIFTCDDGAIKQYEDVVTYGGDKQLNFTLPYGSPYSMSFNFGNNVYGTLVYCESYSGNSLLNIKDNTLVNTASFYPYFPCLIGTDDTKAYVIYMDSSTQFYWESTDGSAFGDRTNFSPNIYRGNPSGYRFYHTLGKYLITRRNEAYSYADSMTGTWTQGTLPTGITNPIFLVFSDEFRLLDTTAGKIYSTTDLTQTCTDTGETPTFPSGNTYSVLGDVLFCYMSSSSGYVYYSLDKGATWNTTDLPTGSYNIVYAEKSGTWIAIQTNNTSKYYLTTNPASWTETTPTTGTTIYDGLCPSYNSAYTVSTTGASRIFTGVQHNRSLNSLNGSISGASAPTDDVTIGYLGQIYVDTTNKDAYICVESDPTIPTYTWKQITLT